jgi:hypothetical protein
MEPGGLSNVSSTSDSTSSIVVLKILGVGWFEVVASPLVELRIQEPWILPRFPGNGFWLNKIN